MKVVCTGMSGTDRRGYLREVQELAARQGKRLQVFDVTATMREIAAERGTPWADETILDAFIPHLEEQRATALERILAQADNHQDWVVLTHALFRWKDTLIRGLEPFYLNLLKPDMYVTVCDGILQIQQRLGEERRWEWITLDDLLAWREEEQFVTAGWAAVQRKPFFIIARDAPPDTLYKLIFVPKAKTAYLSYPMTAVTDADTAATQDLHALRDRLREDMVVFDPASVNDFQTPGSEQAVSDGSGDLRSSQTQGEIFTERQLEHIIRQIRDRDYKLVEQSNMLIAYQHTTASSPGVYHEMMYARFFGKEVYAIWAPDTPISPFFEGDCTPVGTPFRTKESLLNYFVENGLLSGATPPSIEPRADGSTPPVLARTGKVKHK